MVWYLCMNAPKHIYVLWFNMLFVAMKPKSETNEINIIVLNA